MGSAVGTYNLLQSAVWSVVAALPHGVQRPAVGTPEVIPDDKLTFITGPVAGDTFLTGADQYHRGYGIVPRNLTSLEQLVADLGNSALTGTGTIRRMRIISHADASNIFVPFFTGDTVGVIEPQLSGYASSEAAGMRAMIAHYSSSSSVYFLVQDNVELFLNHIRQGSSADLQPFALHANSTQLTADTRDLIRRLIDRWYLTNGSHLIQTQDTQGNVTGTAAATGPDVAVLVETTRRLTLDVQARVVGSDTPGSNPAQKITTAHVNRLSSLIAAAPVPSTPLRATIRRRLVTHLAQANRAISGTFRAELTTARGRFDGNSVIDIRGCNVGQHSNYLDAVRTFFGSAARPRVNAPEWFQSFPFRMLTVGTGTTNIDQIFNNGRANISRADVVKNLEDWKAMVGFTDHFAFMRSLFTGDPLPFLSLRWMHWRRTTTGVPPLGLEARRLESVINSQTRTPSAVLPALAALVGLATAHVPNTADLTTLDGVQPTALQLLTIGDDVRAATDAPEAMSPLLTRCQDVATKLAGFTAPAAPSPVTKTFVEGFVASMTTHLANALPAALATYRTEMDRLLGRPAAEIRYFVMAGMPLLIQRRNAQTQHIREFGLVIWGDGADRDNGLRSWMKSQWKGATQQEAAMRARIDGLTFDWSNIQHHGRVATVVETRPQTSRAEISPRDEYQSHIKSQP